MSLSPIRMIVLGYFSATGKRPTKLYDWQRRQIIDKLHTVNPKYNKRQLRRQLNTVLGSDDPYRETRGGSGRGQGRHPIKRLK